MTFVVYSTAIHRMNAYKCRSNKIMNFCRISRGITRLPSISIASSHLNIIEYSVCGSSRSSSRNFLKSGCDKRWNSIALIDIRGLLKFGMWLVSLMISSSLIWLQWNVMKMTILSSKHHQLTTQNVLQKSSATAAIRRHAFHPQLYRWIWFVI